MMAKRAVSMHQARFCLSGSRSTVYPNVPLPRPLRATLGNDRRQLGLVGTTEQSLHALVVAGLDALASRAIVGDRVRAAQRPAIRRAFADQLLVQVDAEVGRIGRG